MGSELSEFLEIVSPIPLRCRERESVFKSWVFWSEYEGSQNNSSSSADVGNPAVIRDKITSALSESPQRFFGCFAQFWAPVRNGGRWVLSTSGQPFAVSCLSKEFAKYRVYSEKYKYNIDDVNQHDNYEGNHMIISGGPSSAFLNRFPYINQLQWVPSDHRCIKLNISVMVPICFPSQSSSCNCIGVLEFTFNHFSYFNSEALLSDTVRALKESGLYVFHVQDVIPYKTVNGLELAKDEIQEALKVVCESHNLALAQVFIPYEDKSNVPFSYSSKDTQTKQLLAIKLTGYLNAVAKQDLYHFKSYFRLGDVTSHAIVKELSLVTLQDYESRYISKLRYDMLIDWRNSCFNATYSALAICLSNDTGDFNYTFEFIWKKQSKYVVFLEDLLLRLKGCLPKFKFASGVELGNELDVHKNDNETKFKIFKGKGTVVVDYTAPSDMWCKTTTKVLSRDVIEKQFGKTMKDAAENLNVCLSTLKRKIKKHGISEWPGPNFVKRNKNDLSTIQINTHEEDNGTIEDTSTVNLNKNALTIKAKYSDDMIKFHLPLSQATFVTVEKEIGKRLKLSDGTYKLRYLDEDKDWISLTSDEEMLDCIKSSRQSDRIVVRMHVLPLPSPQPTSGPSGSLRIYSI